MENKKRLRLTVFRSNKYLYAQLIDGAGTVVAAVHPKEVKGASGSEKAHELGKLLAQKALKKGQNLVRFDRNGYKYHGSVKALADGARQGGLQF